MSFLRCFIFVQLATQLCFVGACQKKLSESETRGQAFDNPTSNMTVRIVTQTTLKGVSEQISAIPSAASITNPMQRCELPAGTVVILRSPSTSTLDQHIFLNISSVNYPATIPPLNEEIQTDLDNPEDVYDPTVSGQGNKNSPEETTCTLTSGWVYLPHIFEQPSIALPQFEASNAARRLVSAITKNRRDTVTGANICLRSTWTGKCHPCVASAMDIAGIWPLGVYSSGNPNPNAFIRNWKKSGLKLKSVMDRYNQNEKLAPPGTILFWSKCSDRYALAGHIAVITETGKKAISDKVESPILNCRAAGGRLVEMLYPTD